MKYGEYENDLGFFILHIFFVVAFNAQKNAHNWVAINVLNHGCYFSTWSIFQKCINLRDLKGSLGLDFSSIVIKIWIIMKKFCEFIFLSPLRVFSHLLVTLVILRTTLSSAINYNISFHFPLKLPFRPIYHNVELLIHWFFVYAASFHDSHQNISLSR